MFRPLTISATNLASYSPKRWSSAPSTATVANCNRNVHGLSHKIRALLRETAQPVAVVTSLMPTPSCGAQGATSTSTLPGPSKFHGATLSSFTSISMSPHHLVAFSLRVPSRMAASLASLPLAASMQSHMVINLLAAPQARVASLFSRPDIHPHPFEDPGVRWSLSPDGFPMLHGCLGALSCRVIGAPWPLNDLTALGDKSIHHAKGGADTVHMGDVQSELFIAEVIRVENLPQAEDLEGGTPLRTLPLVYHRQGYTTTSKRLTPDPKSDG
ncbi:flavin reductase like domain-containing protein [Lactarius quietus]|nr:flavin reductase like domain-containing protein [Lactarius quietus]